MLTSKDESPYPSLLLNKKIIAKIRNRDDGVDFNLGKHPLFSKILVVFFNDKLISGILSNSDFVHIHIFDDSGNLYWCNLFEEIELSDIGIAESSFVIQCECPFEFNSLTVVRKESSFPLNLPSVGFFACKSEKFDFVPYLDSGIYFRNLSKIYLTGTFKSGTTWLESIFNQFENTFVFHEGNTLRVLFRSDNNIKFNPELLNKKFIKWVPSSPQTSVFENGLFDAALSDCLFKFYGSISGSKYVVDRTPNSFQDLIRCLPFLGPIKAVHIVRNPFDALISLIHHDINLFHDKRYSLLFFDSSIVSELSSEISTDKFVVDRCFRLGKFDEFFDLWAKEQKHALFYSKSNNPSLKFVYYEELLTNPYYVVKDLMDFLGMHSSSIEIAEIVNSTNFFTLSNGRHSGVEDHNSFFRKGVSNDFKNYFLSDPKELMSHEFLQLLTAFRYNYV